VNFGIGVETFQYYFQRISFVYMCIDIHIEEIAASFDIFHIHTTEVFYHALAKVIPVFVCIQCPARFGDGYCTWESLIVAVVIAGHVFRPDVTLYTDDMLFHQFVCIVRYRVVAVSLFKRIISTDGDGSYLRFFLILIQICVWIWCHNGVVSGFGCI